MNNKKLWLAAGIAVVGIILFLNRKSVKRVVTDAVLDSIIAFIIAVNEGGAKVITDEGGLTKYGIAQKYHPNLNIRALTLDDAKAIYRKEYLAKLPIITDPLLLYQVFDMAINAGVGAALKLYKKGMTAEQYKSARLQYYSTRKGWANLNNRKSWTRRVVNGFHV